MRFIKAISIGAKMIRKLNQLFRDKANPANDNKDPVYDGWRIYLYNPSLIRLWLSCIARLTVKNFPRVRIAINRMIIPVTISADPR